MGPKRIAALVASGAILILAIASAASLFENLEADKIMVIQAPMSGDLAVYTEPGLKIQKFGKVTKYPRTLLWSFDPTVNDEFTPLLTRFNDAAEGRIHGSMRVQFPLAKEKVILMHKHFGSATAVRGGLIKPTVQKCITLIGPLINSQESLAEKRGDIISWTEDMANNGVYRTRTEEYKVADEVSGTEKTATRAVIILDDASGRPMRAEDSKLASYGIFVDNMSISDIEYGVKVIAQIDRRREAQMGVETAIAEAKAAEQRALTVEQDGKANAAQAKWEQEVIKAQQITEAEQKREVARLAKEAAAYTKQEQILLGEGEAERKRLVMDADGALEIKVDAYKYAVDKFASAIASYQGAWVPAIVQGSSNGAGVASTPGGAATELLNLFAIKAARDLALDMTMTAGVPHNEKGGGDDSR